MPPALGLGPHFANVEPTFASTASFWIVPKGDQGVNVSTHVARFFSRKQRGRVLCLRLHPPQPKLWPLLRGKGRACHEDQG